MKREPIIYIVDDDDAVRDSLELLLESEGKTVRSFAAGLTFLERADLERQGCVLLDVRMPDINGLDLQERLAGTGTRLPVIIMTGHGDVPMAVRAMKAGAVDFIQKPFTDQQMLDSIERALTLGERLGQEQAEAKRAGERIAGLTPREREVMESLVAGHPNKVIAYELDISPRTVEIHRARVMEKMQVRSLSELVRLALAAGISPPSG